MMGSTKLSLSRARLIRALHRGKGRRQEGAYLAEGLRLLDELARSDASPRFLFATDRHAPWLLERFPGVDLFIIDDDAPSLFATENAQGAGAVIDMSDPPSLAESAGRPGPLIYLDALADPGNVGTILRTAEWFGFRTILFGQGSVDPYNPKVVRSSMGSIFRMELLEDISHQDVLDLGRSVFALDAGGPHVLGQSILPSDAVYVVGGEAHGVSPVLRSHADLLTIPGSGGVESLNAAIAASILLYELSRASR